MNAPDFAKSIRKRLEETGHDPSWLIRRCGGRPGKAAIYAFLAHRHKLSIKNVEKIAGILGLDLLPVARVSPGRRPRVSPPRILD